MQWKELLSLPKKTVLGWYQGNTFQFGAALAFYGAFALAPMMYLTIGMAGMVYGEEAAQGQLAKTLAVALGPAVADAIEESLTYVHVNRSGAMATVIGLGLVLFAVTSFLIQLQVALNFIWGVQPKPGNGIWTMLRNRILAFLLVLGLGLLLLLLLAANAALVTMHQFLPDHSWTSDSQLWATVKWGVLLILHMLLVALIYKLLPDAVITWWDTMVGALISALLMLIGNYLIGYYLSRIAPTFAYWAASSLVVVMLWVYYSSQVLLFGAEFTKNYAALAGRPVRPTNNAIYQSSRSISAGDNR